MSANVTLRSARIERLSALEETWKVDSNQQIKLSSGGRYVLQTKPTNFFSWGKQLFLRWKSPEERASFRAANEQLKQDIQAIYGSEAGEKFQKKFASRITSGQPISTGRVKAFFEEAKLPSVCAHETPEQQDYKRLFNHGAVEKKPASDLSETFRSLPSSGSETKTILSPDIKLLSEMGYMTDPDSNPDMLIPSGCVQILGSEARSHLLEQALYEPAARKKDIKELQTERALAHEEALTRLSTLRESLAFVDTPQAQAEIKEEALNAEIQAAHAAKQSAILDDVDSWPPKKLAAYAQMHALVKEAREAPDKKSTEIAKLKEALEKLRSQSINSSLSAEKISKLTTDIETAQNKLSRLTQHRSNILTESAKDGGWESWSPENQLQFVHQHELDPISFDRIKLKINGQFLDCSDSKSFDENFNIFKAALEQLNPEVAATEDHFRELISLCDRNKTTAGTPAGVYHDENDLPSFGQAVSLIPTEINCYEITLSPDKKSFDFHFDSNRSLLNNITLSGGASSNVNLTPNFLYTANGIEISKEKGSLSADFLLLERRCNFTWRYTPVADAKGGNMGFGNLDLIDSRQGFWPLEQKHQSTLDSRTQPYINAAYTNLEKAINDPNALKDYAKTGHVWEHNVAGSTVSEANSTKLSTDLVSPSTLPPNIQDKLNQILQQEIPKNSSTAAKIHDWAKNEITSETLPDISEQFYQDLGRTHYFYSDTNEQKVSLYDLNKGSDDEEEKQKAVHALVSFVGGPQKALAISQIANQQFSLAPILDDIYTSGIIQLDNGEKGMLAMKKGGTTLRQTFSKSTTGDIILHVHADQSPQIFIPLKDSSNTTDLDLNQSFVKYDYNLTFHFDDKNRMTTTASPINYDYKLVKA